jgi:hypothetical protein
MPGATSTAISPFLTPASLTRFTGVERVLAYHHARPFWLTHIVVVAKRHLASLTTLVIEDESDFRALFAAMHGLLAMSRPLKVQQVF